MKTLSEINEKIKEGNVYVVTAEEMTSLVKELGVKEASKQVDVVTTGTFGTMCSSGVFLNFGHSDPPIKMEKVWLNDVEAYTGIAAVDAYLGATQLSTKSSEYGGAHVIEDLVSGKTVSLRAISQGTDCYPRKEIETEISLEDINQAILLNPRNAYQKYNAATNSSDEVLYTYMGMLLPNFGNVTFSGVGCLSPLSNDPEYRTIGLGTRIFLGGTTGYVIGEGTQHSPENGYATLMVKGNLKEMSPKYLKAACIQGYGVSLYVGIGIPIPILDENLAKATSISDEDIVTKIIDFGVPRRDKPVIKEVSYAELKSGAVEINGREVKVSSLSSLLKAREIAEKLKELIKKGEFLLSLPIESLPRKGKLKPMKQTNGITLVRYVMSKAEIISKETSIEDAAKMILEKRVNHLPVVSEEGKLIGIVTSWDISKAVALGKFEKVEDIMTKRVITASPNDPIDIAARKLEQHEISALPVVNERKEVIGMVTSEHLSKLLVRR